MSHFSHFLQINSSCNFSTYSVGLWFLIFLFFAEMNNTSASESVKDDALLSVFEASLWGTAFGCVGVLIVVSNSLIMVAFLKTKPRRKNAHYFLMNLAVADLLVGAIPVPFYVSYFINQRTWKDNRSVRMAHSTFDILCGLSSVFTLTVLAIERLFATLCPWRYRVTSRRPYFVAIGSTWVLAIGVSSVNIGYYYKVFSTEFHYLVIASLSVSICVVCVSYTTLKIKSKRQNRTRKDSTNERKLSTTLLFLSCIFLISWMPFEVIFISVHFCEKCHVSTNVIFLTKLIHYSNSFINAVIYSFKIPDFRRAIAASLCHRRPNQNVDHLMQIITRPSETSVYQRTSLRSSQCYTER